MKQITVTIVNGEARIETKGFAGADCHKETADLERAIGARTADRITPEYHQTATATLKAGGR